MLIRFNVKNFLSFSSHVDDEGNERAEEFSMISGKVRSKEEHVVRVNENLKTLKFAAVFGANASGKSNLVKAISFMRYTTVKGLPIGFGTLFCKTKVENKRKPSYFEMELLLDGNSYSYGFEVLLHEGRFVSEWLIELNPNGDRTIFSRDIDNGSYVIGEELQIDRKLKEKMEVYAGDISNDSTALLLFVMNQNKRSLYENYKQVKVFQKVYQWMKNDLVVKFPSTASDYTFMTSADTDSVKRIIDYISSFGTGITSYKIAEIDEAAFLSNVPIEERAMLIQEIETKIQEMKANSIDSKGSIIMRGEKDFYIFSHENGVDKWQTIQFSHGEPDIFFELHEESDGTVRILDLLEILLAKDKTYVVDELDRCLHPCLTYRFVEQFFVGARNTEKQLIVTTHESRLLDFDLLRRDEIWFVNKKEGKSSIYSLEEYNERFDKKIDKAYLEGRYGGVPIFTTLFPVEEV